MIIEDIVDAIDEGGPRSYYSFETFVIHLFRHHLIAQDKELVIDQGRPNYFDAIIPKGFDEFTGKTILEIKFNFARIPMRQFIEKTLQHMLTAIDEQKISNLIIISAKPISTKLRHKFTDEIHNLELDINIYLWGPKELNIIANKYKKVVNDIASNLFSLRLKSVISKPIIDWKIEREVIINNLKSSYKNGQFSLFLGAGISSSAGMPDWNTLLNSLFITYLTKEFTDDINVNNDDISELVNRLSTIDEPSALMAARYLRKGLSKNTENQKGFIEAITKNLYHLRNKEVKIDSELIKAIVSICLPKRTGAKIKSIITYNFDDLLERELLTKTIQHRCIYTENESYDPDELPVYHVHGFLPEIRKNYESLNHSTLVFSEEGYHKIYEDSYHWSNLVQLNSFRENNCLMVGLSMTDPNLRRLLDISSRSLEKSKHFTFMKRLSKDNFCYQKGKKLVSNIESAEKFLEMHHSLNQELMKELGVTIIWYESHNDIPIILKSITE